MGLGDARELIAGSVGGACATVVEYPLDTIKVRLQNDGKRYSSVWQCICTIAKEEGVINGFFRGLPAPVMGAAMESAVLFFSYRTVLDSYQRAVYGRCLALDTEPYGAVAFSGAVGGLIVAQLLTPIELIKCKMQIQNTLPPAERVYKDSLDCVVATYTRRGVKGLYRGHVAMMLREVIGCAMYFVAYQGVIRAFLKENQSFQDVSPALHLMGGGCAGVAFWTSTYPIDAVKTKQQTMKADYLKLNFRQSCARLYKTEGMRGFFRGYGVTALRAFPGNAIVFAVYEQVYMICDMMQK